MIRPPAHRLLVVLTVCASLATAYPAGGRTENVAADPLARVAWLAGCWERTSPNRVTHEQWMAPLSGLMLGMSRTVRDGRVVEFEAVRIDAQDGVLIYTAKPSGQPEASFRQSGLTDTSVTFMNLEHDFPKVIRYLARGDSMIAQIEGPRDGETRVVDFRYRRAPCPGR